MSRRQVVRNANKALKGKALNEVIGKGIRRGLKAYREGLPNLTSQSFEETRCMAMVPSPCRWPECECKKREPEPKPKALRTSAVVKLRVPVTHKPLAGCAIYRKGKLVFIKSGALEIGGRISNYFHWATIKPDGTLGRDTHGYW